LYSYVRTNINIEARSLNHGCRGKAITFAYSGCVCVALVIQHAERMRRIIVTSVACLYSIFAHYFIKRTIFGEKVIDHKMCVLIFSTSSV